MIYKINNEMENIRILGEKFVENNKRNFKLFINKKEFELCEYIKYDKKKLNIKKNENVVDDDIKVIKEVEEDKEDDEEKESDKNEEERDQIDKILLEEFPKKYKCKYNFTKKNKNEYMFNDMNIYAYFDEENNKKLLFKK